METIRQDQGSHKEVEGDEGMTKLLGELPERCAIEAEDILCMVNKDFLRVFNTDYLQETNPTTLNRVPELVLRDSFRFIPLEFFE